MATMDVCLFLEPGNGLGMHCSLRQLQYKNTKQNIMTNYTKRLWSSVILLASDNPMPMILGLGFFFSFHTTPFLVVKCVVD